MRVLVIDDSVIQRMMLRKILGAAGHSVLEASDGTTAIAQLLHGPDVIVCDIRMPGLDGYGMLGYLRNRRSEVPVVIATADIHVSTEARCRALGAVAFVPKPYCPEQIRAAVADAGAALKSRTEKN